jgi:hypothetical protein
MYLSSSGVAAAATASHWDNTNGLLGIGTASPTAPLHVGDGTAYQNGTTTITKLALMDSTVATIGTVNIQMGKASSTYDSFFLSYVNLGASSASNYAAFNWYNGATTMAIQASGRVGIGTVSPAYPLHVGISGGTSGSVKYWNFNTPTISSYSGPFSASIYGISDIVTSGSFTAFSDKRAKLIEEPLEETFSNLVQKIDVHQYSWINKAEKGGTKRVGFFAQEVEKVLPAAVGKTTSVVPTIYREADSFTDTTITIKGHGLTTEKKIEVVDPENDKHVAEITRVVDSDTIEVKFEKKPKDKLFVIGPEVDDSRLVNHDYLMAISFGAVKEIIEENKSLRNQISCLASRLDALVEQLK